MKKGKRYISILLIITMLLSSVFSTIIFAENPSDINISQEYDVDVVLSVGNTTKDVSSFNADLTAALVAKGIPANRIKIQSIEAKNVDAQSNFAWEVYDHTNFSNKEIQYYRPYYNDAFAGQVYGAGYAPQWNVENHINVYNQDNQVNIDFRGYGAPAYKDFMFMENNNYGKKKFDFTIKEGYFYDALDGAGFLFNTSMTAKTDLANRKMSGYLVFFRYTASSSAPPVLEVYKFTNIDVNSFHNATNANISAYAGFTKLASSSLPGSETVRNVAIEATAASLKMWYNNTLVNWTLNPSGSSNEVLLNQDFGAYGFGPLTSYSSHGCARPTLFTFNNITMTTESTKRFSEIIREPEWRSSSKRFIVNLENNLVSDFSNPQKLGEILTRLGNDDIHYIGWGTTNTNKTEADGFIAKNDDKGIFVDNAAPSSIGDIADYIYGIYNNSKTNSVIYIEKDKPQQLTITPSSEKYDTKDTDWPQGKWKVNHTPGHFDNNEGLAVFDNQYLDDMDVTFDKPGKYEVYYKDSSVKTVYVHRRPIAGFSVALDEDLNVALTDNSYDLDHSTAPDKGIKAVVYQWKESSDIFWNSGPPTTLTADKEYIIQQKVQDLEDEWSIAYSKYISTSPAVSNVPPIAEFTFAKNTIFKTSGILTIQDTSYSPSGAISERAWIVEKDGVEVYNGAAAMTDFSEEQPGIYKVKLKVKNDNNVWSEYFTRAFTLVDDSSAPTIQVSPIPGTFNDIMNINLTYDDAGGSKFAFQQYAITNDSSTPAESSPSWSGKSNVSNVVIPLTQLGTYYIHYKAEDNAGNNLSGCSGPYYLLSENDYDVQLDKDALEIGYAVGDHANSVTKNIVLPLSAENGSSVSWSSDTSSLADALGNVYRPTAAQGDRSVILTATLRKGLSTATKTFNLLIKAVPATDIEAVALDKAALEIGYEQGDYAESVTQTITLPTTTANGSIVTWSSNIPGTISNGGVVTRPEYSIGNKKVIMTATIEKNAVQETRTFELIVIKNATASDSEAVAEDKENLVIGYQPGDNENFVTRNIILPVTASNGSNVTWESDSTDAIDIDGTVIRPEKGDGDATVVVTATISRGSTTDTRVFTLIVKEKLSNSHEEEIAQDKALLSIEYQPGDNANHVTQNIALADSASNGSTVTWGSDDENVIDVDGTVIRPSYTEGEKQVILTATLTNHGLTETRIFKLLVKALNATAEENVVEIGYQEGDSEDSVTKDVTLPNLSSNGSPVIWSSSDTNIIGTDGTVTRPTEADAEVTLTADINEGEDTQPFVLKVLKAGKDYSSEVGDVEANLEIGYAPGDDANSVTQNVILPVEQFASGSVVDIIWSSDSPDAIDEAGNVYRPDYNDGDKHVTLTAIIKKGLDSLTKIFDVIVKALTHDNTDALAVEEDALELEIGYQHGDSASHVTENVILDTTLPKGSIVSWSSDKGSIANSGTVTRPNTGSGDESVTLIATITSGTASTTKKFVVVVKQQEEDYTADLEAAKTNLEIIYAEGDSAASVTQNITLPLTGENETTVTWSSDDNTTADQWGNIFRPASEEENKTVVLTAVISKGGSSITKNFTILVKSLSEDNNDNKILARDKASLGIGYAEGDNASSVTRDVELFASVSEGTTVAWSSSKENITSSGQVIRPAEGQADQPVVLTATLSRGELSEQKVFEVIVKAIPSISDEDLLALDKASLEIGYAAGDSASSVTQNVELTATAENGSTVVWSSNKENITSSGQVTRPTYAEGDLTVLLTASLTKGEFSDQKTFTVVVKAAPQDPDEVALIADKVSLGIGYATGDSASSVTRNVTLPTVSTNGSTVTWSSDKTNINTDGQVTRPRYSAGDQTVVLTATLTKGIFSDQKVFTLVVKATPRQETVIQIPAKEVITVDVKGNSGDTVSNAVVERTTTSDGKKKDTVTYEENKAKEAVDKLKANNETTAKIVIPDKKDEVGEVEVKLTKGSIAAFANSKINLEMYTDNGRIIIPQDSLQEINQDLYFRVVPIKEQAKRTQVEQQVAKDQLTLEIAAGRTVSLVERPSTIETNMSSKPVTIVLPLREAKLPTAAAARASYLKNLFVYIEHHDGDKEILRGTLVDYDGSGTSGLEFGINKFSTFAIAYMASEVLTFKLPGLVGDADIDYLNGIIKVNVDENTDITKLPATFELSEGATVTVNGVKQVSGVTLNDYTKPVTFVVTGADGTVKTWTVILTKVKGAAIGGHKAYINGYVDGTMKPDNNITRAEMAAILYRILKDDLGAAKGKTWPDVKNNYWAKESIENVTGWGIMVGLPDGSFSPNGLLTRAEMATIISRWTKLRDRGTSALTDIKGHWAQADIEKSAKAGYMIGYLDSSFKPNKNITRAEVVTTVNRVLKRGPLYGVTKPSWPDVAASYWAFKDIEEASKDHSYTMTPEGTEMKK